MVRLVPITEKWGDSELVFKPTANGDDENMSVYGKKEKNLVWMRSKRKGAQKWVWYGDVYHIDRAIERLIFFGCDLDKGKELEMSGRKGWIVKDKNGKRWCIEPVSVEHSYETVLGSQEGKGAKLRAYIEQKCKEHNHRADKWEEEQEYEVA
jgi:hypothetical protein